MESGPRDAKILLLGEFPGEDDIRTSLPFSGASGDELRRMLSSAGIDYDSCFTTQVFSQRPPSNDLEKWMVKKAALPSGYDIPAYARGAYLHPAYVPQLRETQRLISSLQPNIILALGSAALWALTGSGGIAASRGSVIEQELSPGNWRKIIPTYSPSTVLRSWPFRPVVIKDFIKARRESARPIFHRPARSLLIAPTVEELEQYVSKNLISASLIALDIETANRQITCISFALSASSAVVIPLWDMSTESGSYYSARDELAVWKIIRAVCASPVPKLMQNGTYDTQYLVAAGCSVQNFFSDTLILHHALYPELQKGLGFLGSIYTDEPSWKHMRKTETSKRDE